MRAVVFRGGVAEEQCKPMTLLSSDLQHGGAVAGVIGKRQSRMIGELDLFLSADFLTPFASSRKNRRSPTTGPAGQHRRQVTRTPPRAWVRAPTTSAIAMWSSAAGPERPGPPVWAPRLT